MGFTIGAENSDFIDALLANEEESGLRVSFGEYANSFGGTSTTTVAALKDVVEPFQDAAGLSASTQMLHGDLSLLANNGLIEPLEEDDLGYLQEDSEVTLTETGIAVVKHFLGNLDLD